MSAANNLLASMTTNVNDYQRKKSAVQQKGYVVIQDSRLAFDDLTSVLAYLVTCPRWKCSARHCHHVMRRSSCLMRASISFRNKSHLTGMTMLMPSNSKKSSKIRTYFTRALIMTRVTWWIRWTNLYFSNFGEVWKAVYKKGDSAETSVAVQVLQGAYSREKYQGLKQAMDTINKCRHQNLFSYFGTSSVNSDVWVRNNTILI